MPGFQLFRSQNTNKIHEADDGSPELRPTVITFVNKAQ